MRSGDTQSTQPSKTGKGPSADDQPLLLTWLVAKPLLPLL